MVKHNNVVPNQHFHKDWQNRVKTWFDQAPRKKQRRLARAKKAAAISPRPSAGPLRPVVHCPTQRYNMKVRAGRGFSLEELKAAKISKKFARTIGIAVDHRRRNKSQESLQANVDRLKEYQSKLVLFPRKGNKIRQGDASKEETDAASQLQGTVLPIRVAEKALEFVKITDDMKESAYTEIRNLRSVERHCGQWVKRKEEKAKEAAAKKKKKK
jgi:large subunit ribosomal protein L13e